MVKLRLAQNSNVPETLLVASVTCFAFGVRKC